MNLHIGSRVRAKEGPFAGIEGELIFVSIDGSCSVKPNLSQPYVTDEDNLEVLDWGDVPFETSILEWK